MPETKDIFYIILAFATLWFTVFLCWLIYQVIRIVRNLNQTVSEARRILGEIQDSFGQIRDKFLHTTNAIAMLIEGGKKLNEYLTEKKKERQNEESDKL